MLSLLKTGDHPFVPKGETSLAMFLSLLLASDLFIVAFSQTFGNGLAGVPICGSSRSPTVILNYSIPIDGNFTHAVLHHFWMTGGPSPEIDRIFIDYFIDGEVTPSISFQPSFMCGLQFPQFVDHDYEYSASGLCGKTAPVGGYSNVFPIPFYKSALVTARADPIDGPDVCVGGYLNVRGSLNLPLTVPGSGRPLPIGTRLTLQKNPLSLWQPLQFVPVAALPAGKKGEVFMVSWAVEAQPEGGPGEGGGYIEGCWNFYTTANVSYPGLVVGTGVEDYFDSGYYFGADSGDPLGILFANALSGLTQFQREVPYERLSAYRFHNTDPLFMADGGLLTWQVGSKGRPGTTKCGNVGVPGWEGLVGLHPPILNSSRVLSPINVTTYAWLYVYPGAYACDNSTGQPMCVASGVGGDSQRPDCCQAPPLPPPAPPTPSPPPPTPTPVPGPPEKVGCASGFCYAFCDNPAVHGCVAGGWDTSGVSMRAEPTGKACGGPLGACTSPADACAAGWKLCLMDAAIDPGSIENFRNNLTAAECASGGNVAYVAAMSHAKQVWSHLPPNPCQ